LDDEDRTCVTCGGVFQCNKYAKQVHCSYVCAGRGKYERPFFQVTCETCSTEYTARDRRARFCSNACRKRSYRKAAQP
jgi:hypothetical protein